MTLFSNYDGLITNAVNDRVAILRQHALSILESGVSAVDPYELILNSVRLEDGQLRIRGTTEALDIELSGINKKRLVAFGKASMAMARAFETIVDIDDGIVVIPRGQRGERPDMEIIEAEHPVPGTGSVNAANRVLEIAHASGDNDLLFVLVSGGGSALLAKPADGITLTDKIELTKELLRSGAKINELNIVRKHISAIKGGKLAEAAYPATTIALILSDVVGDPVDVIASGPTVPDASTGKDAQAILLKYGLWTKLPGTVRDYIKHERRVKVHSRVHNIIIGNNYVAADAACKRATDIGYGPILLTTHLEGESREVAKVFTAILRDIRTRGTPANPPVAVIAGGETTVKVVGNGRGGRNQEFVLSAALSLPAGDDGVVIAAMGTDGIDGMSDAAGAIADGYTLMRASEAELDPETYLQNNDSNTFFSMLNDALITGRTGTNVNDLIVMLVADTGQ